MYMSGMGTPQGPEFLSPNIYERPNHSGPDSPSTVHVHDNPASRKWPGIAALSITVVAVSVGGGATAGYLAGQGDAASTAEESVAGSATPGVPANLVGAAAATLPGVVSVQVRTGSSTSSGSGFVFDARGHIVTNNHVVSGGGTVSVVGQDGRRLTAEVIGTDSGSDIAVLRVTPSAALRPLSLASPNTTQVGEPVLAVGSPLGLSGTVTAGIVSALDRQVRLGGSSRQTALQTDASINPGNSGGPLVNTRGQVIGVNTAIATLEGGGSIGIGFAVPIDRAQRVATTLIARG
jgi:S1-C subfamily serine protease